MNDAFPLWVVYDHPRDYPDHIVVRRQWAYSWIWPGGDHRVPVLFYDPEARLLPSIGVARGWLRSMGLTCLTRDGGDDPVIVETWI